MTSLTSNASPIAAKKRKAVSFPDSDVPISKLPTPSTAGNDDDDDDDEESSEEEKDEETIVQLSVTDFPFPYHLYEGLVDDTLEGANDARQSSSSSSSSIPTPHLELDGRQKSVLMIYMPKVSSPTMGFEILVSVRQGQWFVEWQLHPPSDLTSLPISVSRLVAQAIPRSKKGTINFRPSGGLPLDESAKISIQRLDPYWVVAACPVRLPVDMTNLSLFNLS